MYRDGAECLSVTMRVTLRTIAFFLSLIFLLDLVNCQYEYDEFAYASLEEEDETFPLEVKSNKVRVVRHYFNKLSKYLGNFNKHRKNILSGVKEWLTQMRNVLKNVPRTGVLRFIMLLIETLIESTL